MSNTKYVLYHGNCPDGFGAAFAAWLRFGDDAEYIPVSYGKPMPDMLTGDATEVYILDFSYPSREIINLVTRHGKVVVLDHHHTAKMELESLMEEYNSDPYLIRFDMNKSGAVLACEYFHGDSIKCEVNQLGEFFAYLQDRDLWTFKLPQSREVSMALRSYPMDFRKWSEITGLVSQGQIYELPGICIDALKKEGVACRRLTEQQVHNMAKHHRWGYFDTIKKTIRFTSELEPGGNGEPMVPEHVQIMPVANATVFFSEVGERLLELNPAIDCAAYYLDRKDGKRQWGLRSRKTFDCSKVAQAFGGGGHKQASGFVQEL
jgi:hypothetical protein